jgi:hypothetical protein
MEKTFMRRLQDGLVGIVVSKVKGFHWMASYGNYLRKTGYAP